MAPPERDTTLPRKPGERTKFVIAIDFGTAFSGVGWALENSPGDIEVILEWPGRGNANSQKVPTVISYNASGARWGYQINDCEAAIRGIKLLLDESKVIEYGPSIESQSLVDEKRPVDVAGDFLKKLLRHTEGVLDRRGLGSLMKTWEVQYILTVPAVWSDKAKELTIQAACRAGMPKSNLCLLSEPEAGAVYAIRTVQPNSISKNDSFIVCDAGGGTVDLITYRVTQIEPMRFAEVTEGTGAMCGSMILDKHFKDFLIELVGRNNWDTLPDQTKMIILNRWKDEVKTHYEGPDTSEDYLDAGGFIPLPGIPDIPGKGVSGGMFYMENSQIKEVFSHSTKEIEDLIAKQQTEAVKAGCPVKTIILVGRFGSSKYLFNRLETRFSGMRIIQPQNAWSAIIRGAVLRGLEGNRVDNRKARCNYGVEHTSKFDPYLHRGQTPYWCNTWEEQKVGHQMTWYIRKGESLSEKARIKIPFVRLIPLNGSFVFHEDLSLCFDDNAPMTRTANVSEVCELVADLSRIPKSLFKKRQTSKGLEYYSVDYDLVVTPLSASLLFELEFNSVSYGTVRANYS